MNAQYKKRLKYFRTKYKDLRERRLEVQAMTPEELLMEVGYYEMR